VIPLRGGELVIERPHDVEALLDEEAFGEDEFIPYWAELWASGRELADALSGRSLRGARVLELGCGLALPSFAAAMAGGRVTATDWSEDALALARENAERNELTIETALCDWRAPDPIVDRGPWDLVLAADVLYEQRNVDLLLDLLPRLGPEIWLADPGRQPAERFFGEAEETWARTTTRRIHHLRRR
jgi:predicted nicotinamide N-methyase